MIIFLILFYAVMVFIAYIFWGIVFGGQDNAIGKTLTAAIISVIAFQIFCNWWFSLS